MKKTLYLECYSGISGDMTVGALLDLGADPQVLKKALDSLQVEGYEIKIGRTKKCGIDACDFDVILTDQEEDGHSHDVDAAGGCHEHGHGEGHSDDHEHGGGQHHEHEHEHGHDHPHDHDHEHHHEHEHEHHHDHDHENTHHHPHEHRNIRDVFAVIDRLDASGAVKEKAREIFRIVARAEAGAHGISEDEVHFHEVGAIDSIVDIVSVAVCLDNLGIEEVVVSPLYEGSGHVRCQHGIIPVPVPAVANIVSMEHLILRMTDNRGEMVTPTGAAIAAALRTQEALPENYRVEKIGIGAGKKDFPRANILRAMLIVPEEKEPAKGSGEDVIWKLESNIDDCSGEDLGFMMEGLMEAGARDVFYSPVYMKKNRPAYLLQVICMEDKIEELEDIIFAHTTTVGIRRMRMERTVLDRRIDKVQTPYGPVQVKVCSRKGITRVYPEYESIKKICKEYQEDFQKIYHCAVTAAEKNGMEE